MKITRRSIIALPAVAAGLGSCGKSGKRTIAVIPKGRSHLFWQSVHAGAIAAARETGVEIAWNGPSTETDFNGQIQIVESMINRRVDAIALAPIDKKVMVGVVERAAREKIPVIIFDSPVDTDKFVSQVATDNYAAGKMAADRVGAILKGKGKVIIVACQVGAASTMAREQGFEDKIKEAFPEIKILDKRYGMSEVAPSRTVAENMLTAFPEVDAVFASNESSSMGAALAHKARKSIHSVPFPATTAAMLGDPRRHLGVERFRGRDVNPRRRRYHHGSFGVAALAGARATQDEGQLRVLTGQ